MKLTLFGSFVAEGDPDDLALFMVLFVSGIKTANEMDETEEFQTELDEILKNILGRKEGDEDEEE